MVCFDHLIADRTETRFKSPIQVSLVHTYLIWCWERRSHDFGPRAHPIPEIRAAYKARSAAMSRVFRHAPSGASCVIRARPLLRKNRDGTQRVADSRKNAAMSRNVTTGAG